MPKGNDMQIHLTESLAKGLTKQILHDIHQHDQTEFVKLSEKQGRTAALKRVKMFYEDLYLKEHTIKSVIMGKGKDREYVGLFLDVIEDTTDFGLMMLMVKGRNFKQRKGFMDLLIPSHVIERLFLRMATVDKKKIVDVIVQVTKAIAKRLEKNKGFLKHNATICIENLGNCYFTYDPKSDKLIWRTFIHVNQFTPNQLLVYDLSKKNGFKY